MSASLGKAFQFSEDPLGKSKPPKIIQFPEQIPGDHSANNTPLNSELEVVNQNSFDRNISLLIKYISHEVLNYSAYAGSSTELLLWYAHNYNIDIGLRDTIPGIIRASLRLELLLQIFTQYNTSTFVDTDRIRLDNTIKKLNDAETRLRQQYPNSLPIEATNLEIDPRLEDPTIDSTEKLNLLLNLIWNTCTTLTLACSQGDENTWGERAYEKVQNIYETAIKVYYVLEDITRLWNLINHNAIDTHYSAAQDLQPLIEDVVMEMVDKYQRSEINIYYITIEEAKGAIPLDPRLIRYALKNLISNACKYSPINTPINVILRIEGDCISFQVQDFGIGIPIEDQSRIFDAEYRVSGPARTVEGKGIGLNLAYEIAKAHKGELRVSSKLGIGSTFTLMLPINQQLTES